MKLITAVALALILAAPLGDAKDKKKKDLQPSFPQHGLCTCRRKVASVQ